MGIGLGGLQMVKVVICMPAYNEEDTIGTMVLRCREHSKYVYVVNDCSKDRTEGIARRAGAQVVSHETNLGYGGAVRTSFLIAKREKADCLVILDSDGQHDPQDIPELTGPIIDKEADVVIGSRFKSRSALQKVPFYRMFGIQTITQVFNLGAKMALTDSQSGFRAYSKNALDSIRVTSDRMDASMEILFDAKERKFKIMEVPIEVRYEGVKGSSERPISHGMKVLTHTLRLVRERYPLRFFGSVGAFIIVLIAPVIIYSRATFDIGTGLLPIGSMFVITFLGILGSFFIFTGLMLHGINRFKDRLVQMMAK